MDFLPGYDAWKTAERESSDWPLCPECEGQCDDEHPCDRCESTGRIEPDPTDRYPDYDYI